jgi:hypothetical protein
MQERREPRRDVALPARLESDDGRNEIEILNISSRGLMAKCSQPPIRGTYVEIRLGSTCIVARVAWSGHDRFGAFTQDQIAFSDDEPNGSERTRQHERLFVHQPRRLTVAERQAASARFARLFDFIVLAGAVAAFAILIASLAGQALIEPFERAQVAFRQEPN